MNRSIIIVWLLVICLALVVGWTVHAYGTHPVSDNMCGAHSYGDCFDDGDWIRGWYDYLRHAEAELDATSRAPGWRTFSDTSSNGTPYTGIGFIGNPRVPEATEISPPQTTGSSSQTCHVQIDGSGLQKCVPEEKFWCDKLRSYREGSTAREYVEFTMPSHISC